MVNLGKHKYMTYSIEGYSENDLKEICANWVHELNKASLGNQNTCLVFAGHTIQVRKKNNLAALAVVIGGSHLIVGRVIRTTNGIQILSDSKSVLPKLETKEILFGLLAKIIPEDVSDIVLNFAYPMQPVTSTDLPDGVLVASTKEHKLEGLIGQQIGLELGKFLQAKLNRQFRIAVANDTVCLVLAGLSQSPKNQLVGGVVGTGFNFGLFVNEQTLVNLESANFNNFRQTTTGHKVCEQSQNPEKGRYEKETSGAYLFQHYNLLAQELGFSPIKSTAELNLIALSKLPESEIARDLFDRSASLTAAHMAGIFFYKKQEKLNFVMEGSLFWQGWNYRNQVYTHLGKLGINFGQIQILKLERSYLLGAGELII